MITRRSMVLNRWAQACLVGACATLVACGEVEVRTMPVSISGTISVPAGAESGSKVYINVYHAWALEGDLRHPVEYIDGVEAAAGRFSVDVAYPLDNGEGLLVYAWLDSDADGVLCTPGDRNDLAGLVEVDSFPAAEVTVQIDLTVPCAGPDWFYPPATQANSQ
jgi:hypothetical protein